MPQKIQEKYGIIFKKYYFSYLNFLELRTFLKFGPTEPHVFLIFVVGIPPKKLGISERFQRMFRAWNLGISGRSFFGH